MYVRFRYVALCALFLGAMVSGLSVHAETHKGTTSTAKGIIYQCKNHVVDVFGDEEGDHGFAVSVDHEAAIQLMDTFTYPDDVIMSVFGDVKDKRRVVISQEMHHKRKEI
ncbi:hypothetical protein, partial [Herbiconiux daphne]